MHHRILFRPAAAYEVVDDSSPNRGSSINLVCVPPSCAAEMTSAEDVD